MLCHCFDNINCSFCSRLYAFLWHTNWFFFYILFHIIAEICSKCILLTPRSRVVLSLLWYFKILFCVQLFTLEVNNFVSLLLCIMKLSKYVLNVFFWRQTKLFFYILFLPPCIAAFSNSVLEPVKILHVNQRIALRLLHCSTHHYTENTHVLFSQLLFSYERGVRK